METRKNKTEPDEYPASKEEAAKLRRQLLARVYLYLLSLSVESEQPKAI